MKHLNQDTFWLQHLQKGSHRWNECWSSGPIHGQPSRFDQGPVADGRQTQTGRQTAKVPLKPKQPTAYMITFA